MRRQFSAAVEEWKSSRENYILLVEPFAPDTQLPSCLERIFPHRRSHRWVPYIRVSSYDTGYLTAFNSPSPDVRMLTFLRAIISQLTDMLLVYVGTAPQAFSRPQIDELRRIGETVWVAPYSIDDGKNIIKNLLADVPYPKLFFSLERLDGITVVNGRPDEGLTEKFKSLLCSLVRQRTRGPLVKILWFGSTRPIIRRACEQVGHKSVRQPRSFSEGGEDERVRSQGPLSLSTFNMISPFNQSPSGMGGERY
ncbi:hypothetical protein GGS26DRAFT_560653 [Hypomontagnella submonticulosa]|nr:hypothetical protein GGS26DRAFT_560653 [Hypomontagnella submonticulosa]